MNFATYFPTYISSKTVTGIIFLPKNETVNDRTYKNEAVACISIYLRTTAGV